MCVRIGLLGHGVVGEGVIQVLMANAKVISSRAKNQRLEVTKILDKRDFSACEYSEKFTTNPQEILENPQIDIVVECMGGSEPAFSYLMRALDAKKHCVTSNKQLVVEHGDELIRKAESMGVNFHYEASVGGGIPIIRPLKQCLAANHVNRIMGILNGTTNFILTRMRGGLSYPAALAEAQGLGFAEADPSADLEGHDARRKLAILAHVAFGAEFSDDTLIPCEGIGRVTTQDMMYAKALGGCVRLCAIGVNLENGWNGRVQPCILPEGHALYAVDGVFNAILVTGDMVGDICFMGQGAGKLPTASAVVADIVDAAKHLEPEMIKKDPQPLTIPKLIPDEEGTGQLFFRLRGPDAAQRAASVFAKRILSLLPDEVGVLTQIGDLSALRTAIATFGEDAAQALRFFA